MMNNDSAREAVLAELRKRKLLKYLFADDPAEHGAYGYVEAPINLETQSEIADAIVAAVLSRRVV